MHKFTEDIYLVGWAGGQAVVTLPEHIGISNAGQVREELLPAAAVARAEGVPGRGSGDSTAAQQAHLRMLDAVITGLSQVELGLQAALGQPADPARKRTGEALDDLTGVIGEIRAVVSAASGQPRPAHGDLSPARDDHSIIVIK
jgi:hypothetical protein